MKTLRPQILMAGFIFYFVPALAQDIPDTTSNLHDITDTTLRVRNLNPYFTLLVDSMLNYQLEINRGSQGYY